MKYNVISVICLLLLYACNNAPTTNTSNLENVVDTTQMANTDVDEAYSIDDSYYQNLAYKGIKIFEPRAYSDDPYIKDLFNIMDTLVGLFEVNGVYKLKECWIEKVNVFENQCTGNPDIEPTLNTKDKCLFLFKGFKNYKKGVVNKLGADFYTWANESSKFVSNGTVYELKAEGRVIEDKGKGDNRWQNVRDYKLYLTSVSKTQCIVEMKYFNDAMTRVCFIGDLDGDGKPDFIINSPDHYETNRVMLLLSSYAEDGDFVKTVSITVDSFDC